MNRRLLSAVAALAALLMLSSCINGPMKAGLSALDGEPIQTAFGVLGYPDGRLDLGTGVVYSWSNDRMGTISVPHTAQTSGYVDGSYVTATTTYNTYQPVHYFARIKLATDRKGIINDWSYDGNLGGLGSYSRALGRYAKQKKKAQEAAQQASTARAAGAAH